MSGGMSVADENAIRAVVSAYEAAWNRHDMSALPKLLTADADWINIVGMHWRGSRAVVTAHEAFHRTMFARMDIHVSEIRIRSIAPEVAVAVIVLRAGAFTAPDGTRRPAADDRLSLILVRQGTEWRIAHGHNTVIDPTAQPFDPVGTEQNVRA